MWIFCQTLEIRPPKMPQGFYYRLQLDEIKALKIIKHRHWVTLFGVNMVFVNFASILKQSHGCMKFHEWMRIMKLMRPVNWQSEESNEKVCNSKKIPSDFNLESTWIQLVYYKYNANVRSQNFTWARSL